MSSLEFVTSAEVITKSVNPIEIKEKLILNSAQFTDEEIIYILFYPESFGILKLENPPTNISC